MTPAAIIQAAAVDGVRLALTEAGTLKTVGHPDAVQHWLPRLREHKAEIVQLLGAANDPTAAPASHWMIHFADRDPLELYVSPALSHAEVLAAHPDAVAAEPVPERVSTRAATAREHAELLALISAIYAADADQDRAEAIDAALADPEGALQCYRAIAAERGITVVLPVITRPTSITVATGCKSCRHRKRPGRSDPGYCSWRDDLPPAYGLHHPLHRLPDDQGASCASYQTIEG